MYYSTIHSYEWIVLFCAVIRAMNYTDWHDVDEDLQIITNHGGQWADHGRAGMMYRRESIAPNYTGEIVASSNI